MSGYVRGKSIVITGGTTGLGFGLIRELLENGAKNLAVLDIHDVDNVVGNLQQEYVQQNVIYLKTDVSDKEHVRKSFREAIEAFGGIDVVIGNAGIFDESQPEKTIAVNLIGIIHSTYEAIEHMSTSTGGKGGLIVNISSVLGLDAMHSTPSYTASKHAILGLMRSLGTEFYENLHGIKFVTFCPGYTDSALTHSVKSDQLPWGIDFEELALSQRVMPRQTPSEFAKVAVKILNEPENGKIWIIDGCEQREVVLTPHWRKF